MLFSNIKCLNEIKSTKILYYTQTIRVETAYRLPYNSHLDDIKVDILDASCIESEGCLLGTRRRLRPPRKKI